MMQDNGCSVGASTPSFSFIAIEQTKSTHEELQRLEERCSREANNIVLLSYLANEYFRLGYFKKCMAAARLVVQREPSRAKTWQLLARCQLIIGEKEEAKEALYRCLEHPEAGSRTKKWSAERLNSLSEPEPAVRPLGKTDEATEAVRSNLERHGVLTAIQKPEAQQVATVRELYTANPDNAAIADWYAFLLYSNNETAAAIDVYRQMYERFGPSENTLYYLGCAHLRTANVKQALTRWNQLKRHYPRSYFMPKVFSKVRALRALHEKGCALSSHEARRSEEGRALSKDKSFDAGSAAEEADAMVRDDANNPTALDWAAYIHYTKGHYGRARTLYEQALQLGYDKAEIYYYLGAAYRAEGHLDKTKAVWTELVKRFPLTKLAGKALDELKLLSAD